MILFIWGLSLAFLASAVGSLIWKDRVLAGIACMVLSIILMIKGMSVPSWDPWGVLFACTLLAAFGAMVVLAEYPLPKRNK